VRVPPFHWWRTVFFLIPAISIYTIVLGTLSLGSSLFERSGRFAHWCARTWSRLILVTTGVEVELSGLDRLDRDRAYVFVANHQSIYDIPIIFWSLPYQIRIIAKASLGAFPFIGWHLRHTGHMLVDRKQPARALHVFARASKLMKEGLCLIVFPEGTRSRDGRVAPFKGGSFLLALRTGLPVVPLSVVGSRHVMLKGRLATYPGHVKLIVHEPIDTSGLIEADPQAARAFAARVRDVIAPDAESDVDHADPQGPRRDQNPGRDRDDSKGPRRMHEMTARP
jgi:1-acyl-sn-glycerol-3-phosphate acyltransferase